MLKDEIKRMWGIKKVIVIPLVVGVSGAISTGFQKYVAAIGIKMKVEQAQKTALYRTARTLRLVLGCLKKPKKPASSSCPPGYHPHPEILTSPFFTQAPSDKNLNISIHVHDSVRPLTIGCYPLSQNEPDQLTTNALKG